MTTYNRFLDIHLCAEATAGVRNDFPPARNANLYFGTGGRHFYEFSSDIMKQMRYRESKAEGFNFSNDNKGNCKILEQTELTDATDHWLGLNSALNTTGGGSRVSYMIRDELKQLRYVGCMVSIEKLRLNDVYPQLQALMLWISDPATQNKLRINCHGSGTSTGGMNMGEEDLSAPELVGALVRHGLTRPSSSSSHATSALGLAQNARWKLDKEKDSCENCNKKFGVFTLKHHCRRCGGLFCDKCSSKKATLKVALTGEERGKVIQQTATASNVKNARVCDACYAFVTNPSARTVAAEGDAVLMEMWGDEKAVRTDYGLKTITLALCMGAKADDAYSPERDPTFGPQPAATTFVRDSLASRVLTELRTHNLRGIKVTASNQVVAGSADGIVAQSEVKYPEKKTGDTVQSAIKNGFPAYVWGNKPSVKTLIDRPAFSPFSQDITVSPCGRAVYFGGWPRGINSTDFSDQIFRLWNFPSWQKNKIDMPLLPGATTVRRTWRVMAPPRVQSIRLIVAPDKNRIELTVRNNGDIEMFKQYKSYEVS